MNTPAHSRMNLNRLFGDFNRWSLTRTFHDLFCSSDYYSEQSMELPFTEEHVRSVFREGVFEFRSYEKIPFFVVELKERHRIQALTGKKYQFSVARSVLRHTGYDAGLFLFFNPSEAAFRISYVFSVYADNRRTFSHYRRHSFYVARHIPNRTFLQQFSGCSFASADDIRRAFSLEPVTKEFYQQLEKWYYQALQQVRFPAIGDPSPTQKNVWLIRFITRMLFIWFLKVKGVVPEKLFDENYVRIILKDKLDPESSSYYLAILQNLFFATLNTAPENRKFRKDPTTGKFNEHYMKHHVFRHHALVEHPDIFSDLFGSIPFLNGGIFECLDYVKEEPDGSGKEIRMDGFSDVKSKQPHFPNRLLFGNNPEGPGLISLLNTFHFTIDENSPVDEDVALDPELLGHVFENLLATFNPETAQNARKLSGSFYTPRQVVDFMCRRALAHYLHTGIAGLTIQTALHLTSDADTLPEGITETQKMQVVQALLKCRVLDPACGSGAFPMGMLQRMVWILRKTDPDCKLLNREKEIHLRSVIKDFDKHADFINKVIQKTDDYKRKIHLIENCIFGTDIQPIAIQISKLRFFISLLAEEEVNPDAPNMGLRPLPNLDVKFLVANSLIALKNMSANLMQEQINKLRELMHEFFEARSYEEKNRIRRKFEALKKEMLDLMYGFNQAEVARQVEEFHPFYTDRVHNWFDPFLMFGINNGFDIVIGNPPYISTKGVDDQMKKILIKNYGFADDTYNHFYFKSMELLKNNGILAFITSKTFWTIQTKRNLRNLLLNNKILVIFDTANPFQLAMIDTCIMIVQKQTPDEEHLITFLDGKKNLTEPDKYTVAQHIFSTAPNRVIFIPTPFNLKIYEKLGKTVSDLLTKWWDKISTSKNIEKNKNELEEYRKSLKPGDITLLGLITEGGQGLATANNGKYIGVLEGTKWSTKIRKERPEKLLLAKDFCRKQNINSIQEARAFLEKLCEKEIRQLFEDIKQQYGRDIFGQGWLYRIVGREEIADVETLTDDEKLNGIEGPRTFVPYDKGDKDGNRWYAPTPYYMDWSRENVKFLKENSGKKGEGMPVIRNPQFYFREGFCWTDVNSTYLKSRVKENGVYDVLTMSLFTCTKIPDFYFVCLINSKFISEYVGDFVNSTSHFQINDARQLPIIIPTSDQIKQFENIFKQAYEIQKEKFNGKISKNEAEKILEVIQKKLDTMVEKMYMG